MKYALATVVAMLGLVGAASAQVQPVPGAPGYCRWFNGIVWQTAVCASIPGYTVPLGGVVGRRGFDHRGFDRGHAHGHR